MKSIFVTLSIFTFSAACAPLSKVGIGSPSKKEAAKSSVDICYKKVDEILGQHHRNFDESNKGRTVNDQFVSPSKDAMPLLKQNNEDLQKKLDSLYDTHSKLLNSKDSASVWKSIEAIQEFIKTEDVKLKAATADDEANIKAIDGHIQALSYSHGLLENEAKALNCASRTELIESAALIATTQISLLRRERDVYLSNKTRRTEKEMHKVYELHELLVSKYETLGGRIL